MDFFRRSTLLVKTLYKQFEENNESDAEPDTEREYFSLISNLMTEFTEATENDNFNLVWV